MPNPEQPEPTTIQNPADLHEEKAISIQDLPHTLVLAPLYQLPLGKGKRYLNNGPARLPRWRMGDQHGSALRVRIPIAFCCATGIPGWDNPIRYNRVPGQSLKSASYRSGKINPLVAGEVSFFNAAAFIDPNSTANRGTRSLYLWQHTSGSTGEVRMQHHDDEDISVMKATPVREGVRCC